MIGASLNWIIDRQIDWHKLFPAFWISWFFFYETEIHYYFIVLVIGFLSGRYCAKIGNFLESKWKAKQNRVRWGKYINK